MVHTVDGLLHVTCGDLKELFWMETFIYRLSKIFSINKSNLSAYNPTNFCMETEYFAVTTLAENCNNRSPQLFGSTPQTLV